MKKTTIEKTPFKSSRLAVEIAGTRFKNPVLAASGTYGYGLEFSEFIHHRVLRN